MIDEPGSVAGDDDGFTTVSGKGKRRARSRGRSSYAGSNFDAESVAGSEAGNSEWGPISNGPW